jgi:hypothetical protein
MMLTSPNPSKDLPQPLQRRGLREELVKSPLTPGCSPGKNKRKKKEYTKP